VGTEDDFRTARLETYRGDSVTVPRTVDVSDEFFPTGVGDSRSPVPVRRGLPRRH